ncbi:putative secreted protein (Por secretion system target) [Flavobacterium sp. 270]|uniref:T9SS type A sorting domain-containing protein n=1 Tax=Flavobacterium sp. 270 TaxID=2512114 RepID=UPI001064DD5D|nr:T9SS type A sorting domain-containing protein [Flavobacterium sp. 270]TDW50033.1 putative secreted protein (Por secretion system target) [Flavobacterium sp. 270]
MKTKLLLLLLLANFTIYAQINLVPNSGFETWSGSVLSNWTIANTVTSSTDFIGGQYSARLSYTTLSPKITAQVPMKAGVTYTVKFNYKYLTSNYGGDHPIALNISKAGSATTLSSSTFATNNLWTEKATTFTPDQDLSYDLSISGFSFDNAAYSFLIDDVQVYVQGTEQYTKIPDVEFEKKLIAMGVDSGPTDGQVLTSKAKTVKTLDFNNIPALADLTGIQDFEILESLSYNGGSYSAGNGGGGKLKIIDLSKNTKLTSLNIYATQLASLDISKNVNLITINLSGNKFTTLNTSSNLALKNLNLSANLLTSLDVTKNLALYTLDISSTGLSTFNLSNNTQLGGLYIQNLGLKNLDVSNLLDLVGLDCSQNQLTSLDVSKNTKLAYFACDSNQLTSLDLSKHTSLTFFKGSKNKLKSLNFRNGKNTLISTGSFDVRENPELSCIIVDDAIYSLNKWGTYKDSASYFSNFDCATVSQIPDVAFEEKLINLGIDTDGKNGTVFNSSIASITSLDVSNSSITSLSGIEGFTALKTLNVSGNLLQKLDLSKNSALTTLNTTGNAALKCIQVANLDVAANWAVTKDAATSLNIDCNDYTKIPDINFENKLIALGIDSGTPNGKVLTSNVKDLKSLDVKNSAIADLTGIEDFVSLNTLQANNNKIKTLDLSKNINLTFLDINSNYTVETLNVSKNTKLTQLYCNSNKITSLDLSGLTELSILYCGTNQLASLDLSKNTKLTTVRIDENRALTTLNLQNGKNTSISSISMIYCSSLYCVLVDDVAYANSKWTNSKDAIVSFSLTCSTPEYISIPDQEFEKALMSNNVDGVLDGKVLKSRVEATENLTFDGKLISDLTGLQYFKNLKTLDCSSSFNSTPSKLTKLDISALTNLTSLDCSFLGLTTINTSNNLALTYLRATSNLLTTIDVSKNKALETLSIENNKITELNVTGNTALIGLYCSNNPLSEVNVTKNKALQYLYGTDLLINSLDLSQNTALKNLDIERDRVKVLDLSNNLKLEFLNCSQNGLTSLDISKNTVLKEVNCYNNRLQNLNLKNGNNKNFVINAWYYRGFTENANLTCIEVDDVEYSKANWASIKDAKANYSNSCPAVLVYTTIPDTNFENKLIDLKIDTDGKNGKVLTSSIYTVTTLDVSASNITDLTGIEDFASLRSLNCSKNQLNKLSVSKNILLNSLKCSNNEIIDLDVSKNTQLVTLSASFNKITKLDVSKNTALKEFDCANNNLYSLNVKNGNNINMQNMIFGNFTENPNLLCIQVDDAAFSLDKWIAKDAKANYSTEACQVNLQYTKIPDINFEKLLIQQGYDKDGQNGKVLTSDISKLTSLNVSDTTLKISDLTGIEDFAELEVLNCYSNELTTLDLSKNKKLTNLDCSSNKLTSLNVSKNTALQYLHCRTNSLTEIDLSQNLLLYFVGINDNKLTNINVSQNLKLETFYASNNLITSVDLSKNKDLKYLIITNTALTQIDLTSNKVLKTLDVSKNKLASLDLSQNTSLYSVDVSSNQLSTLNLKNGINSTMSTLNFTSNPKLYCILVDDVVLANTKWSGKKDAIATYNTECTGEIVVPSNNFVIETKGESCLGENNGEISITAKTAFAYSASINGKAAAFTNNALKVTALTPGIYAITITIPGQIFEQNFNVTIAKGATITGKSSITSRKVDVEITEGTAPFTVFVDGQAQFETTDSNFSLDLNKAALVEVATAKACEGVYSKKISTMDVFGSLTAYPNPTTGSFEIEIPVNKNEVKIEIYNFGGQLVSTKNYTIENGKAQLNLENQPSGIYAAKIYLDTPEYIKIIKK